MNINNSHMGDFIPLTEKLIGEIWIDIFGYEGLYQVSNYGRVKNLNRGTFILYSINKSGYAVIKLFKNNKGVQHKLHRIIALAFLPNPNNYPIINHKDEIKANNNLSNLEWCTH